MTDLDEGNTFESNEFRSAEPAKDQNKNSIWALELDHLLPKNTNHINLLNLYIPAQHQITIYTYPNT